MKETVRIRLWACILIGATCAAATEPAAEPAPLRSAPRAPLITSVQVQQRLEATMLPELEFRDAYLLAVMQFIEQATGVKIVVDPAAAQLGTKLTFNARNISAEDALRALTSSSRTKYRIHNSYVLILPLKTDDSKAPMQVRAFDVPQGAMNDARTEGVVSYLKGLGVRFPEGASAKYLFASGRLVVYNTPHNLVVTEKVVRALGGRPTHR